MDVVAIAFQALDKFADALRVMSDFGDDYVMGLLHLVCKDFVAEKCTFFVHCIGTNAAVEFWQNCLRVIVVYDGGARRCAMCSAIVDFPAAGGPTTT